MSKHWRRSVNTRAFLCAVRRRRVARQWSNSLKQLQQRLGKYYKRSEARGAAFDYIQALLSPVERKNGWQMGRVIKVLIEKNMHGEIRSGKGFQRVFVVVLQKVEIRVEKKR